MIAAMRPPLSALPLLLANALPPPAPEVFNTETIRHAVQVLKANESMPLPCPMCGVPSYAIVMALPHKVVCAACGAEILRRLYSASLTRASNPPTP